MYPFNSCVWIAWWWNPTGNRAYWWGTGAANDEEVKGWD